MKTTTLRIAFALFFMIISICSNAQVLMESDASGEYRSIEDRTGFGRSDSVQSQHKEIPRGLSVWTIDPISGDRYAAVPDTTWYMRHNYSFNEGLQGEYNTIGNNGTPRINRIFTDRPVASDFMFVDGYDFFITKPEDFHFTNTFSPITNLQYNECGDKTDGEDNFKAMFAVNAGKRIGMGFKFNYMYDRGYYDNQSVSHFGYTTWGSYLGDRYQAHLLLSLNHQKEAENGGIINDDYITHPELFSRSFKGNEIPTQLETNYNNNNNQHVFFNHRYSLGFYRKVKMTDDEIKAKKFAAQSAKENADDKNNDPKGRMTKREKGDGDAPSGRPKDAVIAGDESILNKPKEDIAKVKVENDATADSLIAEQKKKDEEEQWMKREYVPVTSFFHTAEFDNYKRSYVSMNTPKGYYANDYFPSSADSTFTDDVSLLKLRNTVGVALLEGFNKYAAFGIKAFATHYYQRYGLISKEGSTEYHTDNNISVGAQLSRQQGKALHFNLTGEFYVAGEDIGDFDITGRTEFNFPLLGDTVHLEAIGGYSLANPSDNMMLYHSRHFWWDNDFSKERRGHIEGIFSLPRTGTTLRIAYDNISNYTYLGTSYTVNSTYNQQGTVIAPRQLSDNLSVFTAQLMQNFKFGIFHLDNTLTYQKSSHETVAAVPAFNLYSALYLRFKIARVLDCDLGADIRYFTRYYAPEYAPQLNSYVVQENADRLIKLGNYPYVNAFVNFQLKYCRFFVMFSHVNCGSKGEYFLTPHHPMNQRVLRFGVNWNFFN